MNNGIMDELALCAEKIGKMRDAHWCKSKHLDAAAAALAAFGGELIAQMAEPSAPPTDMPPRPAQATRAAKPRKTAEPQAAPKPAPKAARAKKTETGAAEQGQARTMGVCVICGENYLRRGPAQKTCSAECLAKKRAGLDKHGQPLNAEGIQP